MDLSIPDSADVAVPEVRWLVAPSGGEHAGLDGFPEEARSGQERQVGGPGERARLEDLKSPDDAFGSGSNQVGES